MTRTALVTGCSTGIGRATALEFRDAGWEVYATARDPDDVRDLSDRGCRTLELDVTDDTEVEAAVDRVFDEHDHLDCLVNNAGYGQFGAIEDVPMEGVVEQFDVNAFGPIRLIKAVLPKMREQGSGTIVNVSSVGGRLPLIGLGAYTGSKFALEAMSDALRAEVAPFGVDVVLVEPSLVATDFYHRAVAEVEHIERSEAYRDLYRLLEATRSLDGGGPGVVPPETVAATILEAATAENPDARYPVGRLARAAVLARLLPDGWRDWASRTFADRVGSVIPDSMTE